MGKDSRAQRASYWEEVEDMRTQHEKKRLNEKNWKDISIAVNKQSDNKRTWKQVKYRWLRHLDPTIIKTPFTKNEERIVISAQKQLGNKWTDISLKLPGRTYWQIKNLWFMKLRGLVETKSNITDKDLDKKSSEYVFKCSDFLAPNAERQRPRLSDSSGFSSVSMPLQEKLKKKPTEKKEPVAKKMRILIPKSETKKRQHLNLLTNIISIPLLFANESTRLDVSTDNDSFVDVSPIRITSKKSFLQTEDDLSKFLNEVEQPNTSLSIHDLDIDNSLSKSYDIFAGNEYTTGYEMPKSF